MPWNTHKSQANVVTGIPRCQLHTKLVDPGTNKPFRIQENSIFELYELIWRFTKFGDLIMDSYAGTGVSALAAVRLGRRSISVEMDAELLPYMKKRVESFYIFVQNQISNEVMSLELKTKLAPYEKDTDALIKAATNFYDTDMSLELDNGRPVIREEVFLQLHTVEAPLLQVKESLLSKHMYEGDFNIESH